MIGSWGSGGGRGRGSRRAALLVGLVLVIAAHLTGAVHACSYAGFDPTPVVAQDLPRAVDGADGAGPAAPPPHHRHAAGGHSDHTADRPRAALDDGGPDGEAHQPVPSAAAGGRHARTGWRSPPGTSRPRSNGSARALVGVLRQ
ncbi:hypothetical protein [Streptomyces sp. NRRL S-31]|uniref:hypothetical protein n=1 Tax=Streptomyces sp. NRRL S-31 TaxID=1463898 RepID=UPI0004C755CE|nr:hypothetical protein [Streptomyces sp. NRRL S-31]